MAAIYLGLGSNIDRRSNFIVGIEALREALDELVPSAVYESAAVGFDGENFWNMVVGAQTNLALAELISALKAIEDDCGRDRSGPKFGSRTLDIDILSYDGLIGEHAGIRLPREETFEQAYVLKPLAEIAPDLVLPGESLSCRVLWSQFDQAAQPLKMVDPNWPQGLFGA